MIPKIIHYCWFGNNEKPEIVKDCIKSWEYFLPDYKIIEWNENNTEFLNCFVKKAFKLKKWAFVSDFVRLEKLCEYGGVYLDTDMLLLKNISDLLEVRMFLGAENDSTINAGIIGACKNHDFLQTLLRHYENIEINNFTNLFDIAIPKIITATYKSKYQYNERFNTVIGNSDCIIYPKDYFYSLPSLSVYKKSDYKKFLTLNSYAVHLWGESWLLPNEFELIRKRQYIAGYKQCFYSFNYQKNKMKYVKKILSAMKESLKMY